MLRCRAVQGRWRLLGPDSPPRGALTTCILPELGLQVTLAAPGSRLWEGMTWASILFLEGFPVFSAMSAEHEVHLVVV